jgi:hypothetical protein
VYLNYLTLAVAARNSLALTAFASCFGVFFAKKKMETANETVLKKEEQHVVYHFPWEKHVVHQFPWESSLKETWLNLLGIQKQPLESHKVCSLHFPGGKKVLINSLPTTPM